MSEDNSDFTRELVRGVIDNKEKIDESIQTFAPAWPVKQIPVVDRNILRLAIFEILIDNKVPVKVAINEAVELALQCRFAAKSTQRRGCALYLFLLLVDPCS